MKTTNFVNRVKNTIRGNNFHETTSVACATYFNTCALQALAMYIYTPVHTTGEIMAEEHMEERFSMDSAAQRYIHTCEQEIRSLSIPTLYQLFMKTMS